MSPARDQNSPWLSASKRAIRGVTPLHRDAFHEIFRRFFDAQTLVTPEHKLTAGMLTLRTRFDIILHKYLRMVRAQGVTHAAIIYHQGTDVSAALY